MKYLWFSFLFLIASSCFSGQKNQQELVRMEKTFKSLPINTFRFIGNQIVCKMDESDDENACYRMGRIKIGSDYKPKVKPYKQQALAEGVTASVFVLYSSKEQQTYMVIGHKEGKIKSIQYTGDYPIPNFNFASINLRDSKDKVREVLGPRYRVSKVEEIGGFIWDYSPFRISIEFKGDKVYSIRLIDKD